MIKFNEEYAFRLDGVRFTVRSDTPKEHLDLLCACAPGWTRPMFGAVRNNGCDYMLVTQQAGSFSFARQRAAPRMLVIGDDFGTGGSQGPAAFHASSIRIFLARCHMAIVVSNTPNPAFYEMAASVAARRRRDVVLIETRQPHEQDWARFVGKAAPHIEVSTDAPPSGCDQ